MSGPRGGSILSPFSRSLEGGNRSLSLGRRGHGGSDPLLQYDLFAGPGAEGVALGLPRKRARSCIGHRCRGSHLALLDRARLLASLRGVASWSETATDAARGLGVGHRVAIYNHDGTVTCTPHSNSSETISAWLDLAETLDRPDYTARALEYGAGLVDDPVTGITVAKPAKPTGWRGIGPTRDRVLVATQCACPRTSCATSA